MFLGCPKAPTPNQEEAGIMMTLTPPPAPSPPALISLSFGVCCGMSQLALSISVRRSASFGLSVLRMRLLHHVVVHLSIFSISDF